MVKITLKKNEGRTISSGGLWVFDNEIDNISDKYNVFPKEANTFNTVVRLGVVLPFSILAMTGCLTPLISSNSLCVMPFSFLALISSPISATLKSLSAISSGVNNSFLIIIFYFVDIFIIV